MVNQHLRDTQPLGGIGPQCRLQTTWQGMSAIKTIAHWPRSTASAQRYSSAAQKLASCVYAAPKRAAGN